MIEQIRKGDLDYVPPELIDTAWCLLRHPELTTLEYQDLKSSIKENGILETILVRRIKDAKDNVAVSLIDGLNRLTAAKELGLPIVPCNILSNVDNDEALCLQIQANLFHIQTRKADFAKAVKILIERNRDTMSLPKLSKITGYRVSELRELLNITKLPEDVQNMVNEGIITAKNAIILSKLPPSELFEWIETAQTRPKDFKILAEDRIRELHSHVLKTEEDAPWAPRPVFKKISLVMAEIDQPKAVKQLVHEGMTPEEAFREGLRFTLNIDSISSENRKNDREKLLREAELRRGEGAKKRDAERMKILKAELELLQKKHKINETA